MPIFEFGFRGNYKSPVERVKEDVVNNKLYVTYHPFHKFFICGQDEQLRRYIDDAIISVLKMTKEDFHKIAIENFNGKIRHGHLYFNNGDDAENVIGWINGVLMMNELTKDTNNNGDPYATNSTPGFI
jgi:hypothetical protein